MKIFINERNEIKDVYTTNNKSLKEIEANNLIFNGMSEAKICCQKVELDENDQIISYMLYVPYCVVDTLDKLSLTNELNAANIDFIAMETGIEL